jgi:methyl-accepting chemotaxis protein
LRLRIWLGCLGGVLVAVAGWWWVSVTPISTEAAPPFGTLESRWRLVLGIAGLASVLLAWWLDRGIVGMIRALIDRSRSGRLDVPGEPDGWGELSDLGHELHGLLTQRRQLRHAADELAIMQRQLDAARAAIDRWIESERWPGIPRQEGPLRAFAETVNRGFARETELMTQNHEAARQIRSDLETAAEDARESAEQEEHGFVEVTALLTTVRELQRLGAELKPGATAASAATVEAEAYERWRGVAALAIEELVTASSQSVEHLSTSLLRVQEITSQVQLLGNRATLIALNTVVSGTRTESPSVEGLADELKLLAHDVRRATDRVTDLSLDIEREVASASERMRGIRERVARRLDEAPRSMPTAERDDELARRLERVREMVQDASAKGERLSAASERASRAAASLAQRLIDSVHDMQGLMVRLSPTGAADAPPAAEPGPRGASLKLLDRPSQTTEGESDLGPDREGRS